MFASAMIPLNAALAFVHRPSERAAPRSRRFSSILLMTRPHARHAQVVTFAPRCAESHRLAGLSKARRVAARRRSHAQQSEHGEGPPFVRPRTQGIIPAERGRERAAFQGSRQRRSIIPLCAGASRLKSGQPAERSTALRAGPGKTRLKRAGSALVNFSLSRREQT